jgi:mevalonate kinase
VRISERGCRSVTASAPGKLILLGEHAVVYGRPALVAAVDLRLAATARERPERRPRTVRLEVPRLGLIEEVPWGVVLEHARGARARWERWAEGSDPSPFASVRGGGASHLVQVALGEAARFLDEGGDGGPALDLRIESQIPQGSGFGSSAAAAVAVVAAYLAVREAGASQGEIEGVALEVERRQHGLPSGVDGATVLHGGVLWAERAADGSLRVEPFAGRSPLLADLAVFDTGTPAEGTGTVVAAVRDRFASDPGRVNAVWDRIEGVTRELRALLEATAEPAGGPGADLSGPRRRLCALLHSCEEGLEELGVVPAAVRERVRRVEAEGGAAKISGAGALTGPGAGSLLVAHPETGRAATLSCLGDLVRHPVALGPPGLTVGRLAGEAR